MASSDKPSRTSYQPLIQESESQRRCDCIVRDDDSGVWSKSKAWYPFVVYLTACAALLVCLEFGVDGRDFKTGAAPRFFTSDLYQAQITGLISLSLTVIRTLAGACSALLIWRMILVMLDREGLTLVEVRRVSKYRLPIFPQWKSGAQWLWSVWLAFVILLSLPSEFAAPIVTSAVAWIPSTRTSTIVQPASTKMMDGSENFDFFLYSELRLKSLISAAVYAGKDPTYAFDSTDVRLRRYVHVPEKLPPNSQVNLTVPYFDVDLQWVNGTSPLFVHVGDSEFADIAASSIGSRSNGSVAILRNSSWDPHTATKAINEVFSAHRYIWIKVNTLESSIRQPDGSITHENTLCPTYADILGKFPNVPQHEVHYFGGTSGGWLGKDCFLIANASITAGNYKATNCTVNPMSNDIYAATCPMQTRRQDVSADWLSHTSIDFMSETMQYITMLDTASSFMAQGLESYTTGMLKLAHHAAWSALNNNIASNNVSVSAFPAESVVRASIDHTRLFVWLGVCSLIILAACLVAVAQGISSIKTIQDATLAALLLDLRDVAHSPHAAGLCNAVDLNDEDAKLPKLKFARDHDDKNNRQCRRRVVFANDG